MNRIAILSCRSTVALLASVILLAGCSRNKTDPPEVKSLPNSVTALGRIEPFHGIIQVSGTPGERIEDLLVEEGQDVGAGKELVRLSGQTFRELEHTLAADQYQTSRAVLKTVEADSQAKRAEAALKQQRTQNSLHYEVDLTAMKVELLKRQYDFANDNLERLRSLGAGAVPEQDVKRQDLATETARVDLESARIALKRAEEAKDSGKAEGEAQRKSLEAGLNRVVEEARGQQLTASNNAALARQKEEAGKIKAPQKGKVLAVFSRKGELVGQRPILQIGDTSELAVIAEVPESDVWRVRKEDNAEITIPFLKPLGKTGFTGKVKEIGSIVSPNKISDLNPATLSDIRVVNVKILLSLDNRDRERLARLINLQVEVKITPKSEDNPQ